MHILYILLHLSSPLYDVYKVERSVLRAELVAILAG